jgi:hypothetical protein
MHHRRSPGPAVTGDPGHLSARPVVAVDGKEPSSQGRRDGEGAHAGRGHPRGRAGDRQDKAAKSGKANELTHFRPLLEPAWAVIGEMAGLLSATRVNLRMGGLCGR